MKKHLTTFLIVFISLVAFGQRTERDIKSIYIPGSDRLIKHTEDLLLNEGFETWPPDGWEANGWVQSPWGVPHTGEKFALCNIAGSTLTTPAIILPAGEGYSISFFSRVESSYNPQDLDIAISVNGGEFTNIFQFIGYTSLVYEETEISLVQYAGSTVQIRFTGLTGQNTWDYGFQLDDVTVKELFSNDLAGVKVTGNTSPAVGTETIYSITVKNNGINTQNDYNVKLMREDGIQLGSSVAGTSIEAGEVLTFDIPWTPQNDDQGIIAIYGLVELASDEATANNVTPSLSLFVSSADINVVSIGDGQVLSGSPFSFYYKYSLQQTLYYPSEIGLDGGVMTGVFYSGNFQQSLLEKNIKIWMGETDSANLINGWIDPATLHLVFDGNVDFPEGQNDIFIEFDQPYVYSGKNLVIYSNKNDTAWISGMEFYNTEVPGSQRNRSSQQDEPYNPSVPPENFGVFDNYANIKMFFTNNTGAVEGIVTNDSAPLEGVKVNVLGTLATATSNADGSYELPYLLPGTYDLEFSKFGYNSAIIEDVVVTIGETSTINAEMSLLSNFNVTGIVEGNDNVLIEGALVSLEGYDNYSVVTSADGSFEIPEVYIGTYTLRITAEGYEEYVNSEITVDESLDLGTILISEIINVPYNVRIDVLSQEQGEAHLTWTNLPIGEFRHDDGTVVGQLGNPSGTTNTIMGSAYRNNAVLSEMSWYITSEGGPHNTVKIWIFGLDENGAPDTGDVLFSAEVASVDDQWNTYTFETEIETPSGFLVGVSYQGFLGIGNDAGTDPEWPFVPNANYVVYDYTSEPFEPIESIIEFSSNFMIRAYGLDLGELEYNKAPVATTVSNNNTGFVYSRITEDIKTTHPVMNTNPQKALLGYNVYLDGNIEAENINAFEYQYTDLEEGLHTAGVQSVHTSGTSDIISIDFEIVYSVPGTLTVVTNTSESPEGATVTLQNQDLSQFVYEIQVGPEGVANFDAVRKGNYTITVSLEGYNEYYLQDQIISDTFSLTANLIETIRTPFGLVVETTDLPAGNADFSWNNDQSWSESFEQGDVPEGWSQIINNTGSEAGQLCTWNITGTVVLDAPIVPQDGDYQAFMMWSYEHQDEWLITPEFVAPAGDLVFWYHGTNGSPNQDNYYVKVSTDDGNTWTELWNASDLPEGYNFYQVPAVIDLSAYEGQNIRIAWNNVDGDGQGVWMVWAIDNISVGGVKIDVRDLIVKSSRGTQSNKGANDANSINPVSIEDMVPYRYGNRSFLGYNIYLNGELVQEGLDQENYTFTNLPTGSHTAGVQSVYTSGTSAIKTIDFLMSNVGVDEITNSFTVYPNPANDIVNINSSTIMDGYLLLDLSGRVVSACNTAELNYQINVTGLENGIYFLQVLTNKGVVTHKVLVK